MTNIHIWSPHRYTFDWFEEKLLSIPFFQNGKIKKVELHYWPNSPTTQDICHIFTTALIEHASRNLHVFFFDDDDLEDGCGKGTLELTVRHFINLTKLHPRTYFLFADFIDYLYYDAECSPQEVARFKETILYYCRLHPLRVTYKDFHGTVTSDDCDRYNRLTEQGMGKVYDILARVFQSELPPGVFEQ